MPSKHKYLICPHCKKTKRSDSLKKHSVSCEKKQKKSLRSERLKCEKCNKSLLKKNLKRHIYNMHRKYIFFIYNVPQSCMTENYDGVSLNCDTFESLQSMRKISRELFKKTNVIKVFSTLYRYIDGNYSQFLRGVQVISYQYMQFKRIPEGRFDNLWILNNSVSV